MSDIDEGRKALEAAKEAVERAQFLDMLPVSVAQAAIKAYLAALPGWRLVPVETEKGGYGTRVLSVVIREGEKWPSPPGLGDSE